MLLHTKTPSYIQKGKYSASHKSEIKLSSHEHLLLATILLSLMFINIKPYWYDGYEGIMVELVLLLLRVTMKCYFGKKNIIPFI